MVHGLAFADIVFTFFWIQSNEAANARLIQCSSGLHKYVFGMGYDGKSPYI